MKQLFSFLMILSAAAFSWAQPGSRTLHGFVTDRESGEPVPLTFVEEQNQPKNRVACNQSGEFYLTVSAQCDSVVVRSTGYQTQTFFAGGNQVLHLELTPEPTELDPVEIQAGAVRVLKDPETTVFDYAIWNGRLILLVRLPGRKIAALQEVTPEGKLLGKPVAMPEEPASLFTDCEGNVYAVAKYNAYELFPSNRTLEAKPIAIDTFHSIIEPCAAELEGTYFFRVKVDDQHVAYYMVNQQQQVPVPLTLVADSFALAVLKDDSLMAAKGLNFVSGDEQRDKFQNGLNQRYQQHVILSPVFAPMAAVGQFVYLFDHENGKILRFDAQGKMQGETPITYHKERQWRKNIIPAIEGNAVYTLFEKNGFYEIREVNPGNGTVAAGTRLEHPFVTRIMVMGGNIFYLYRDSNYDPVKRLYRMKMN